MRYKKIIILSVACLIAVTSIYVYKEYNRKKENLDAAIPHLTITATALVNAFENNEAKATSDFTGKIMLVNGIITEINNQDTLVNIYLGDTASLHKVSCMMDTKSLQNKAQLKVGKNLLIKGICNGYLEDVEMNNCVIVNKK